MSKRKMRNDEAVQPLGTVLGQVAEITPDADVSQEMPPAVQLTLALPPLAPPNLAAYRQRHLDVQLSGPQAVAVRRLYDTLDAAGSRLANGKRVASSVDAVRWLLEQLGQALSGAATRAADAPT